MQSISFKDKFLVFADGKILADPEWIEVKEGFGYFKGHPVIMLKLPFKTVTSAPNIINDEGNIIPLPRKPSADMFLVLQEFQTGEPLLTNVTINALRSLIVQLQRENKALKREIAKLRGLINVLSEEGLLPVSSIVGQQVRQMTNILGIKQKESEER